MMRLEDILPHTDGSTGGCGPIHCNLLGPGVRTVGGGGGPLPLPLTLV